jgi:DNA-binding MarR family transcriptional regulator/GNAT superfamily N-acetyltransferase
MASQIAARVAEMRRFNRFYTRLIGALDEGHLGSPFSLAQMRVLYELAHQDAPTASALCEQLALDPGYLSRMLRDLVRRGLVARRRAAADARRHELGLTARGKRVVGTLDGKAAVAVQRVLERVPAVVQHDVVAAMHQIRGAFEPAPAGEPYLLRAHQPGDLGWIIHRHGVLYAAEYGWDDRFEALVARIAADFVDHFKPQRERCWIAERAGQIVGSVFLVERSKTVAQLRLLYVEPAARGLGIGSRLVAECTRFARQARYRSILLTTNRVLAAARRIYRAEGYVLTAETTDETGPNETWELALAGDTEAVSPR